MGDVVPFAPDRKARMRFSGDSASIRRGEIVFFTGVRVERWSPAAIPAIEEPPARGPTPARRRRRRGA